MFWLIVGLFWPYCWMCKGHFLLFVSRVDRVDDINLEKVFVFASDTRESILTLRLFMRRMLFLSTSGIVVQWWLVVMVAMLYLSTSALSTPGTANHILSLLCIFLEFTCPFSYNHIHTAGRKKCIFIIMMMMMMMLMYPKWLHIQHNCKAPHQCCPTLPDDQLRSYWWWGGHEHWQLNSYWQCIKHLVWRNSEIFRAMINVEWPERQNRSLPISCTRTSKKKLEQ